MTETQKISEKKNEEKELTFELLLHNSDYM